MKKTMRCLPIFALLFGPALLTWAATSLPSRRVAVAPAVPPAVLSATAPLPAYHPVNLPNQGLEAVFLGLRGN